MIDYKSMRGGSWYDLPRSCRSALRLRFRPVYATFDVGFRVVCLPRQQSINTQMTATTQNIRIEESANGTSIIAILPGGVELKMLQIPSGSFMMGSAECGDEQPVHEVQLESFCMAETLITHEQWEAIASLPRVKIDLESRPSSSPYQANLPVECVSWHQSVEAVARLSAHTGIEFDLPSEAQWEYACRAGTTTKYNTGDTITTDQANFDGSSEGGVYRHKTTQVKTFAPNAWGLFDMHGNLWEWCKDAYRPNYVGAPTDGSAWTE